jgi:hypothetical protein
MIYFILYYIIGVIIALCASYKMSWYEEITLFDVFISAVLMWGIWPMILLVFLCNKALDFHDWSDKITIYKKK